MILKVTDIDSSVIATVEYDGRTGEGGRGYADITFTSGSVYRYHKVAGDDILALFDDETGTVGENFQTFRRHNKDYERLA